MGWGKVPNKTKQYIINSVDKVESEMISEALNVPGPIADIMVARGCRTVSQARSFLYPRLEDMHDPALLPDMDNAVKHIISSVRQHHKIAIFGDYDVDGVLGTIILKRFFDLLKIDSIVEIPNRFKEGYGINLNAAKRLAQLGCNLIICVDNGTNSLHEINYLRKNGLNVIIVDHHEIAGKLPDALVINPKRNDSCYPFRDLCSTSLSFKFVNAIAEKCRIEEEALKQFLHDSLALVAIATIADVVPLTGENRIFTKWGMEALNNINIKGFQRVIEELKIDPYSTFSLSFKLIPFFNSFGRMKDATSLVKLFLTEDNNEIENIISLGKELNAKRKIEDDKVLNASIPMAESDHPVIIVWDDKWHEGVLGIVAARLVDRFNKPSFVLTKRNGTYKGSVRGIKGVDVTKLMDHCSDLLTKYGGHKMAGGLEMPAVNLEKFVTRLRGVSLPSEDYIVNIDCEIELRDVTVNLAKILRYLEPFGHLNPDPLFMIRDVKLLNQSVVGKNENHTTFILSKNGLSARGISFNKIYDDLDSNGIYDIICQVKLNTYMGREDPEIYIREIIWKS